MRFPFDTHAAARLLFALLWACVTFLSLWPREAVDANIPKDIQSFDALVHAICYATLSASALAAFGRRETPLRWRIAAFLAGALYGILMECLQELPAIRRSFQWEDIACNSFGAALGALLPIFFWTRPKSVKN